MNSLIQNALAAYVSHRHYDQHLKQLRHQLQRLKQQYYQYLSARLSEDCHVHYYPSGYFLWISLPPNVDSTLLYQTMLSHNISIAPSSLFSRSGSQHHIRLNCSFELDNKMRVGLDILIATIKELQSN